MPKMKGAEKQVYAWKPGSRLKANAQIVGAICEELASEGRLTAEDLLETAKDENSPIHNEFTWNDDAAAEKWRLHEARHIINSLEIRIQEVEPVRAFVKLATTEHQYYQTEVIIRKKETRDIVLSNALKELQYFAKKYQCFTELQKVLEAIDELEGGDNNDPCEAD